MFSKQVPLNALVKLVLRWIMSWHGLWLIIESRNGKFKFDCHLVAGYIMDNHATSPSLIFINCKYLTLPWNGYDLSILYVKSETMLAHNIKKWKISHVVQSGMYANSEEKNVSQIGLNAKKYT